MLWGFQQLEQYFDFHCIDLMAFVNDTFLHHQVKFIYESFRRLRPGIPLMALYGKQKQLKRVAIYNDFCKKTEAVLFATDIAARGLGEVFTKITRLHVGIRYRLDIQSCTWFSYSFILHEVMCTLYTSHQSRMLVTTTSLKKPEHFIWYSMYLAQKFFIGDTIVLPLLLESETGPPFYRVIRAIGRFSHLHRGTQRQFSENICSEDDLRSRIFGTFVLKFLAYLPLLGFSNIQKLI